MATTKVLVLVINSSFDSFHDSVRDLIEGSRPGVTLYSVDLVW